MTVQLIKENYLIWTSRGLRLSKLRKDTGLIQNPNQLLQEGKFYLTVGEIFHIYTACES
jgi:hypothetical protein